MRTNDAALVGILADDLTSAADGAAPFVARGLPASIARGRLPSRPRSVAAVDGGTRSLSASDAGLRTATLATELASRAILYKTVDSTLRGHIRVELEAAFKASGRKMLVFAPAFPAAGRTTVGGVQFVDGVPVTDTIYGRDPVHPARHAVLADLVPKGAGETIILNAETQDELNLGVASVPDPQTVLWVGSPGMAHALARRVTPSLTPTDIDAVEGEILVVVGTANPRSHAQAIALKGMPGISVLRSPECREANPAAVLARIVEEAAARLRHGDVAAVIATGGDTMEAILTRLGIDEFEVLRELEPGFPLCCALGHDRRLLLAMKAGGFGDAGTLRRAIARLRRTFPMPDQEQP